MTANPIGARRSSPSVRGARAAWCIASALCDRTSDWDQRRLVYAVLITGGSFGFNDLAEGEDVLVRAGLLRIVGGNAEPSQLLGSVADLDPETATHLILARIDANEMGGDSIAPVDDTVQGWVYRDDEARDLVGAAGEERVVAEFRAEYTRRGLDDLALRVQRVSLLNDGLGYDIVAPRPDGSTLRIEVKTTRMSRPHVFLTRNEADRAPHVDGWCMVVCTVEGDEVAVLGWCDFEPLAPRLPADRDPMCRWSVAELEIDAEDLRMGLPGIHEVASVGSPAFD